ncbi:MAG TPA: hypothetical protein DDZ89_15285 [Clostridiales bacterium]|nr:hypothetical protein [Clostridiales bacterium]
MKFYTILVWHVGANILTYALAFLISISIGLFFDGSAFIPFSITLYIIFLVLSFFYISAKGFKDTEDENFSIIKCLFSCIIAMAANAFFISRDLSGETSLKLLLTSVPYTFVWYVDALKQNLGLWIAILLLINIPVFTVFYGIGYIQYKRRSAKRQVTDSDYFRSEST